MGGRRQRLLTLYQTSGSVSQGLYPDIWQSITRTVPRHLAEYHTDCTQTSGRVSHGLYQTSSSVSQGLYRTSSSVSQGLYQTSSSVSQGLYRTSSSVSQGLYRTSSSVSQGLYRTSSSVSQGLYRTSSSVSQCLYRTSSSVSQGLYHTSSSVSQAPTARTLLARVVQSRTSRWQHSSLRTVSQHSTAHRLGHVRASCISALTRTIQKQTNKLFFFFRGGGGGGGGAQRSTDTWPTPGRKPPVCHVARTTRVAETDGDPSHNPVATSVALRVAMSASRH